MTQRVARIRIEVMYTSPKIWRRVEVPLSFTLIGLHDVIQAAFDWDGDHFWTFNLGKADLGKFGKAEHFRWEPEEAQDVQLQALVNRGIKKLKYIYDYGDYWEHLITIMRVLDADPATTYPNLVAGANCAPIEDIGGVGGFYAFVAATEDPNHPDRERFEECFGAKKMNEFDYEHFDEDRVKSDFAGLR